MNEILRVSYRITQAEREDAHYRRREIERVIESDPAGFYRLLIESDQTGVSTRHLNITREQLDAIVGILGADDA